MSSTQGSIRGITVGGLAGNHSDLASLPVLVAPATADERNTIRPALVPLACWKIEDLRFEFGSSVILPEAKDDLPLLAAPLDQHTKPKPRPRRPRPPATPVPPAAGHP